MRTKSPFAPSYFFFQAPYFSSNFAAPVFLFKPGGESLPIFLAAMELLIYPDVFYHGTT